MAREKKVSIKYFDNMKVKSTKSGAQLYMRLRYDGLQAEIPSLYKEMHAQRLGIDDIPENYIFFQTTESRFGESDHKFETSVVHVTQEEKKSYLEIEKEAVSKIIQLYLNQGINIIGSKPKTYIQYNFTSLSFLLDRHAGLRLSKSLFDQGYVDLAGIIQFEQPLTKKYGALLSISADAFKTQVLDKYRPLFDAVKALESLRELNEVLRVYQWRLKRDECIKSLTQQSITFNNESIIKLLDESIEHHLSQLAITVP
ncbi:hypothetical protein [uncultured Imperialibacter sp.]|uniref:hypothetical protein n=1 Tax=uncultured Imperialibacter sp. TaxID=1672639 RepID=UPI0030DB39BE|tara:strand:+ start:206929 stop:207696 length:768 start_codon:yes stop_codon:yes gene_type:complete